MYDVANEIVANAPNFYPFLVQVNREGRGIGFGMFYGSGTAESASGNCLIQYFGNVYHIMRSSGQIGVYSISTSFVSQ